MGLFTGASPHTISFCDLCRRNVVVCGGCGNNTCNGGYGEVMAPQKGQMMQCPYCASAYELDAQRMKKSLSQQPLQKSI